MALLPIALNSLGNDLRVIISFDIVIVWAGCVTFLKLNSTALLPLVTEQLTRATTLAPLFIVIQLRVQDIFVPQSVDVATCVQFICKLFIRQARLVAATDTFTVTLSPVLLVHNVIDACLFEMYTSFFSVVFTMSISHSVPLIVLLSTLDNIACTNKAKFLDAN